MADIRDWGKFIRGRWDWTRFGYEKGFPRGCQFTDLDAATEFDGQSLLIETKAYDGVGIPGDVGTGQMMFLRDEAKRGKAVFVLWGCGVCNDPYLLLRVGAAREADERFDWRGCDKTWRRAELKRQIDQAMGLSGGGAQRRWPA